jgi:hypothetical protein
MSSYISSGFLIENYFSIYIQRGTFLDNQHFCGVVVSVMTLIFIIYTLRQHNRLEVSSLYPAHFSKHGKNVSVISSYSFLPNIKETT